MAHGIDTEAVEAELADPACVELRKAAAYRRFLREEVVEAEEVAVCEALAGERRLTAVVVVA